MTYTSLKNLANYDLLEEVKNDLQIQDEIIKHEPFFYDSLKRNREKYCSYDFDLNKTPLQSAKEALFEDMNARLEKMGAPVPHTPDEYIYTSAFPEIENPHKFTYDENTSKEYIQWKAWRSKFQKTGSRDSAALIEEINSTTKKLKEELEQRKNNPGCYTKENFECHTCNDDCSDCSDLDTCNYGRVYDDKFIRHFDGELFIGLHELARDKKSGLIDAKKILDPETIFFIDENGQQARELNVPGYGIWQVDLERLGFKFTPYSTIKGNPPAFTYEARNFETRELVTNQILHYDNRLFPLTMDVLANDSDINPDTIQLIDPRSNRPSLKFAVAGEGVWYVDNYNYVVFEVDPAFTGNPTPVLYQAYTNQDEYAGTARIEIDFGGEYVPPTQPDGPTSEDRFPGPPMAV